MNATWRLVEINGKRQRTPKPERCTILRGIRFCATFFSLSLAAFCCWAAFSSVRSVLNIVFEQENMHISGNKQRHTVETLMEVVYMIWIISYKPVSVDLYYIKYSRAFSLPLSFSCFFTRPKCRFVVSIAWCWSLYLSLFVFGPFLF